MAYVDLLDCPSCGKPCEAVPPAGYSRQERHSWWEDGQHGVCACGALVMVEVSENDNGENVAYLSEQDNDDP